MSERDDGHDPLDLWRELFESPDAIDRFAFLRQALTELTMWGRMPPWMYTELVRILDTHPIRTARPGRGRRSMIEQAEQLEVDLNRYGAVNQLIQSGEAVDDALFDLAAEQLEGTPWTGSAGTIKDSFYRIKQRLLVQRRLGQQDSRMKMLILASRPTEHEDGATCQNVSLSTPSCARNTAFPTRGSG